MKLPSIGGGIACEYPGPPAGIHPSPVLLSIFPAIRDCDVFSIDSVGIMKVAQDVLCLGQIVAVDVQRIKCALAPAKRRYSKANP
jgi:hypothetical protein